MPLSKAIEPFDRYRAKPGNAALPFTDEPATAFNTLDW
jgi:hypothetical protein